MDVSTPTSDITTAKIVWNSVVSNPNTKYMCIDMKQSTWYTTYQVQLSPHNHHINPRQYYSAI